MKKILMLGAGVAMLGLTGVALAQAPQPAAPTTPPTQNEAQAAPQGGPDRPDHRPGGPGMRGHWMHGPGMMGMRGPGGPHHFGPPPPPSKAAAFAITRGDTRIRVRCAEDEPMQACVNAASALLDKVSASGTAAR